MIDKCNPIPCDCKDGPIGPQGLRGANGDAGINGEMGLPGNDGVQGAIGEQGEQGLTGIKGTTGSEGTSTIVGGPGQTGPKGPKGPEGEQGPDGNNGNDGVRGDDAPNYNTFIQNVSCTPQPPTVPDYEHIYCTFVTGENQRWVIAHQSGQYRTQLNGAWFSGTPAVGSIITFISTVNTSKWIIAVKAGQKFQMTGGLVTSASTDTVSTGGVTLPTDAQIKFQPSNYSDSISFLHIGNDEHVVISINNAGGLLPTFI